MNNEGNVFEYKGKNINLLDTLDEDDLYKENNESQSQNILKENFFREKLYNMHSASNLRINNNEPIKKRSSSKPKPKINKRNNNSNLNSHYDRSDTNNNVIDINDLIVQNKENNNEKEKENKNKKKEINPRIQRLYEDHNKKLEKQKKLKTQYDNDEMNKYSYAPKINKKSRKIVTSNPKLNKPIQKRTNEIIQETNEKINQLKNHINPNSFNPKINYSFSNNLKKEENVYERLYEPKKGIQNEIEKFIKSEKDIKQRKKNITNDEKECSFHPKTYSNINNNSQFNINKFIEKQNEYLFQSHSKMYNLKKKIEKSEKEKNTFNPNTSFTSTSNAAIKIDIKRQGESLLEKIDRMTYEYAENKEKLKKNLDSYYNNFSFSPEINYNYNNNYLLKNSTNYNFINQSFSGIKKKTLKKSMSSDKLIIPKKYINHKYDHIVSKYILDDDLIKRIDENRNKKYIENLKRKEERELKELKECTFAPKINTNFNINNINEINSYYSPNREENSYTGLKKKKILYDSCNNINNNYNFTENYHPNNYNNYSQNYDLNNNYNINHNSENYNLNKNENSMTQENYNINDYNNNNQEFENYNDNNYNFTDNSEKYNITENENFHFNSKKKY